MDTLLLSLIGWLNLHTEYDTRVELPNIVITEQANMCQSYGIKDQSTCRATQLKGFYDKKLTIYLHPDFDQHDPVDQSRLMHEVVHYIQWHDECEKSECWGHLEVEAYSLQDDWRMQQDIANRTDPFKLIMIGVACDA